MTISNALNNAVTGLTATARLAAVTSGNLANALTPGYGRQEVVLTAAEAGGRGTGVRVEGVVRASDPELTASRRIADGDLAQASASFEALSEFERLFGTDNAPQSLFGRISAFESALRDLAETPEVPSRQQAAADAANALSFKFNQISTETVRLRETADADIARQVDEVNTALRKIATLNRQIQLFTVTGRDNAALIDERARLVDKVAQTLPIRESMGPNGTIEIYTREGVKLAGLTERELSFTPTRVMEPGLTYDGGQGVLGGISVDGLDITPGGPSAQAIGGGALSGLFEVRDQIAPEIEAQADSLAADLILRYQADGIDPTRAPTDPGLFTDRGARFDPANVNGIGRRISLNAAVLADAGGSPTALRDGLYATAPRAPADATIPQALRDAALLRVDTTAAPATLGLVGARTLADRTAAVVELVATARVRAETEVTSLRTARDTLGTEEAAKIGVDNDVELQRLIQIEQAYAANAQVIQTATRMLDELTRIGR